MSKKGKVIVFSGPSGVGKGTIKANLLKEFAGGVVDSISVTTRQPREGEKHGREYFFITMQDYEEQIKNNNLLEHNIYSENGYGTPRDYVNEYIDRGINVILEIDVNGFHQVKEKMPECVSIFVLPPSMEELERRLRGRGTEEEETIQRRLNAARNEIPCAPEYDYRIVNETPEQAYSELRSIYLKEMQA